MSNTIYGIPVLSPNQLRHWDKWTIEKEGISSTHLIENASHAFVDELIKSINLNEKILIFCGLGNNGGDGLTIGRFLNHLKYDVRIFILNDGNASQSHDFEYELLQTRKVLAPILVSSLEEFPTLDSNNIVIDAIFGFGLNRPIEGFLKECILKINKSNCTIFSVDIASGLFASAPNLDATCIEPDFTFTFQTPKLAFLFPQNQLKTGKFKILDIGLNPEFLQNEQSEFYFLQKTEVAKLLIERTTFSHKGNFGHLLLFAGSRGKMGAAMLCAKAALRAGCGLVSVLTETEEMKIVQNGIWEAMCIEYSKSDDSPILPQNSKFTFGIGPGIGKNEQAQRFVKSLLENSDKAVVLDADALNIISENTSLLSFIPANSILTPHPKEFERLVGGWTNDDERLKKQQTFSAKHQVFIVLKGAFSSISCPDKTVYFNSTGNPGMATGGSGDVLTGIISSFLAQNYSPKHATILGVFLHGLAGDLAAYEIGQNSLIACDLIDFIPSAFKELVSLPNFI